jgi:8-oxo-dGTP pyrophosphatase MutT (NUDIX family)
VAKAFCFISSRRHGQDARATGKVMGISPYIAKLREKVGNDLLLLPSVSAIVLDERGRVLLQRSSDDRKWYTIGGAMEPGEEPAAAVVREVMEETGLVVEPVRVTSVQSSPVVVYPNGHRTQYVATTFLCRVIGGTLGVNDDESLELRYFAIGKLPELRADQRERVMRAVEGKEGAYFVK